MSSLLEHPAPLVWPAVDLLDIQMFVERREHEVFRRLRRDAPVYFNREPSGPGFFAVTRYADVAEVLRDFESYSNASGTQITDRRAEGQHRASLHNSDPPEHGPLRAISMPSFGKRMMDLLTPSVRATAAQLIEQCPRGDAFDFVDRVAIKFPMMVIGQLLGVPAADQPSMVEWANAVTDTSSSQARHDQAQAELFEYFRRLVAQKRVDPGDDLTTVLVQGQIDGSPLTADQLDAYFMMLVGAGNETTRFLLAGGLEQLCLQPETLAQLTQSPQAIPAAVEEMIRWVTPVMHMRRTVTRPVSICDVELNPGQKVVVYFVSANRDEAHYEDPDRFRIDRKDNLHLGFGFGRHFCLGSHLARLESRVFFETLLERVADIRLHALGQRLPSHWFRGHVDLPISWH